MIFSQITHSGTKLVYNFSQITGGLPLNGIKRGRMPINGVFQSHYVDWDLGGVTHAYPFINGWLGGGDPDCWRWVSRSVQFHLSKRETDGKRLNEPKCSAASTGMTEENMESLHKTVYTCLIQHPEFPHTLWKETSSKTRTILLNNKTFQTLNYFKSQWNKILNTVIRKKHRCPTPDNRKGVLLSYFEHWCLLLTNEHTDVWVAQISAVDLFVSAAGIDVRKGLIDLQGPNPFVVHPVGGDTSLLAQRPQADGPVRAARQALQANNGRLRFYRSSV